MFTGAVVMMFYTNYILAITAILSSLIGFLLMMVIMMRSQKYFNSFQKGLGDINGHIEEAFTGHNIIKVYNATDEVNKEFDSINNKLFEDGLKSQFYSGLMRPIMGFIGNFGYVMVCIIGALLTMKGVISFGVIVAFMIYVRLFTNPLSQFAAGLTELQSTAAASERVFEFLDLEEMNKEEGFVKLNKESIKGNLEFKNVSFGYNKGKKVIKDLYWDLGWLDPNNFIYYETSVFFDYEQRPSRLTYYEVFIEFLQALIDKQVYNSLFDYFHFNLSILARGDRYCPKKFLRKKCWN